MNKNAIKTWANQVINQGKDYNDYDNKKPVNWDIDDFDSYIKDYLDSSGSPTPKLKMFGLPNEPLFKYYAGQGTGLNNDQYWKKYENFGGAMYDLFTYLKKTVFSNINSEMFVRMGENKQLNLKSLVNKIIKEELSKTVKRKKRSLKETPQHNKTIKPLLDKWTNENTSDKEEYLYLLSKITEEALRDANFYHNGVLNKIPNIFRVKPAFDGGNLDKMAFKFGTTIAEKCDWTPSEIIGSIEFFLRMNGFQSIADNLLKLLENESE